MSLKKSGNTFQGCDVWIEAQDQPEIPPGLIPPPEAIADAMESIRIATIKNEPRSKRMTTESNQTIRVTQAQMTQLAAEAFAEMINRKRQAAEANRAKFREQRRAAKLANWNKRQPKGELLQGEKDAV